MADFIIRTKASKYHPWLLIIWTVVMMMVTVIMMIYGDDDDHRHHHHHNHDHLQPSSLPARPLTPSDNSAPIYGPTLLQLLVRMKCIFIIIINITKCMIGVIMIMFNRDDHELK